MCSYKNFINQLIEDLKNKSVSISEKKFILNIDPLQITNEEINEKNFWSQHGENENRYKELILNYQDAIKLLSENGTLDNLSSENPIKMAYDTFHGSEPIKLINYNGKLILDGSGRHRIESAKLLRQQGYDVKVSALVTKYSNSTNNSIITIQNKNYMSHSIENQIELLEKAKSVFMQHSEEMVNLQKRLNREVRGLEQDEMNHDYLGFIEEFQQVYNAKLSDLNDQIDDEIIPQIKRKIQYLEDRV